MFLTTLPALGAERFIEETVTAQFKNCPDAYFALPYLDVSRLSDAAGIIYPDYDDDNIWDLKSYIAKARRLKNVFVNFKAEKNSLRVEIVRRDSRLSKIDFSDRQYKLLSENYSKKGLNKITVYCEETGAYSDWYLLADGTVTRDYKTSGRYDGGWELMTVKNAAGIEQSVTDKFLSRSYSHLIEFTAPRVLDFYQRVDLRIGGKVLKTYISGITYESGSDYPIYKTGEMRTKFTDKLKEMV